MKIVAIIGSPSRDGNTAVLVREAMRGAAEAGAEIEEIFLPDYQLEFCKGCMSCLSVGNCALADDLQKLKAKLEQSDGIILGSPTHGLMPSAMMKNFLDRIGLFNAYTSALSDKCVAGISTAGGAGARAVAQKLTEINGGFFGKGYVSGVLAATHGWDRIEAFPKYLNKARRLGAAMVDDIRRGRRPNPFSGLVDKLVVGLALRPIMKRNIMDNKDGRMKAVYRHLVRRGWVG